MSETWGSECVTMKCEEKSLLMLVKGGKRKWEVDSGSKRDWVRITGGTNESGNYQPSGN